MSDAQSDTAVPDATESNIVDTNLQDVELQDKKIPYPKSVFFIISTEFCERFSFLGMQTILSLYLRNILHYSEDGATVIYHTFSTFVYFFPLFGAIIADSWLGKFRTITYLAVIYALGNVVLSLSAVTPLHLPAATITLLGLSLIAIGTGGIKACVSAFGGDQFILPQQGALLAKFFSVFYFAINAGSLISTILTPMLRERVHCFGDDSCYSLAFGVPGVLMITAVVCFVSGKSMYKPSIPGGNVVVLVTKCMGHAVVQKIKNCKSSEKKDHWLDYASDKYDKQLIKDIKATIGVFILAIPLPFFWSLYFQQGTGWTFQASRMNGDVGVFTILPDQMQVINPILILAFIPIFDYGVYPLLAKCRLVRTVLQKIVVGGLLAALAFAISALVEQQLRKTYAVLPDAGEAQMRMYNVMPCAVNISQSNEMTLPSLGYSLDTMHFKGESTSVKYIVTPNGCGDVKPITVTFDVHQLDMVAVVIRKNSSKSFEVIRIDDNVEKSDSGLPLVRTIIGLETDKMFDVQFKGPDNVKLNTSVAGMETLEPLQAGTYQLFVNNKKIADKLYFKLGGVYSVIVNVNTKNSSYQQFTISDPNSLSILWLTPQIVVITMAEIMFSIPGLDFSYSQAPESMKSVVGAIWLLTTSIGNLIVVVIEEAHIFDNQVYQYLLYAALMVVDMLVFALLAYRYKYVDYSNPANNNITNDPVKDEKDNREF